MTATQVAINHCHYIWRQLVVDPDEVTHLIVTQKRLDRAKRHDRIARVLLVLSMVLGAGIVGDVTWRVLKRVAFVAPPIALPKADVEPIGGMKFSSGAGYITAAENNGIWLTRPTVLDLGTNPEIRINGKRYVYRCEGDTCLMALVKP